MKIVECVPNISEGRVPEIYNAVADAAASVPGVKLLDVDPGFETNRTVITFVGEPDAVIEGVHAMRDMLEGLDMTFAVVIDGVYTGCDAPFPVRSGRAPGPATVYLLGANAKVVLETFDVPPLRAIQALHP